MCGGLIVWIVSATRGLWGEKDLLGGELGGFSK